MSELPGNGGARGGEASRAILADAGMSDSEATNKQVLLGRCEAALDGWAGARAEASVRYFVPGRVEFLGKHTDYCGGRSLLCGTERGLCIAARPRTDRRIRLAALDLNAGGELNFPVDLSGDAGHWMNYPVTVARRIGKNFPAAPRGADIAFASDLPHAAGMSSSSALIIAVFLVLRDLMHLDEQPEYQRNIRTREDLAGYLATIENGRSFGTLAGDKGVGTFGGSQDHTAILCCQAGCLVQYAFCPVRLEATLPWPKGYVLAIGVSGVVSEKTGAAREHYNRAAERADILAKLWQRKIGRSEERVAAIVRSSAGAADQLREIVKAPELVREFAHLRLPERLEQFLEESERIIPAAAAAIGQHRMEELGRLVDRSQANAETLLGNQVPETMALCREARELGAVAASAFGAGFGGAAWALIDEHEGDRFLRQWQERYLQAFPGRAQSGAAGFFLTRPGPPATRV